METNSTLRRKVLFEKNEFFWGITANKIFLFRKCKIEDLIFCTLGDDIKTHIEENLDDFFIYEISSDKLVFRFKENVNILKKF